MVSIEHKQGDTFVVTCTWTDSTGAAIPLTGYTVTSQVKVLKYNTFADNLTVAVVNEANGIFTLTASATATTSWPVTAGQYGRMFCDVQFSKGGIVTSTETFEIIVLREITQ